MGLLGVGKSYAREQDHCRTCGMEVDPASAYRTEIGGKVYHFCRPSCKASFKKAYFMKTNAAHPESKPPKKGGGGCH